MNKAVSIIPQITTKVEARFWEKVSKWKGPTECWLWCGCKDSSGYGIVRINKRKFSAHRISYFLHFGGILSGMHICHRCDVPSCVNPSHLFEGTDKDNMADCAKKGRISHGEHKWNAKLTEKDIHKIRSMCTHLGILLRKSRNYI